MAAKLETTAAPPQAPPPGPPTRPTLVPLLRRLHFYVGVLVAPLLVTAAVTGLLYAFTPQWDELAYGDQLHPARVGTNPLPLSEQVRAAQEQVPDGTLHSVRPAERPDDTTRVSFTVPELAEQQRTVFVDPYTGKSRGLLTTSGGSTPVTAWLSELHRSLHLGEPGRLYSETAASWLWMLALGGLALWLTQQRGGLPRRRGWRRLLLPDRATQGVRRTRSWHASTGVWLLAFLLVLSATGLTWSAYAGSRFEAALESLDARSPDVDTGLPAGHHGTGPSGAALDPARVGTVVAAARGAGLDGPLVVTPPAEPHQAWTVTEDDDVWPVRYDEVAVDADSGAVVATNRWRDWPVMAQLSRLGIQFHMGKLFGLANQLLLAAVAIGLLAMIFWGYRMWWQRRPTRTDRRLSLGRPPGRGAWRAAHPFWLVAGGVLLVGLAWALPLLGWTLAGFLLLDAALAHRRAARAPG